MALNIKDPETDALARRVAELSGQSLTQAVHSSLEARLAELLRKADQEARLQFMLGIAEEARREQRRRGVEQPPTMDELLGYDEHGLSH